MLPGIAPGSPAAMASALTNELPEKIFFLPFSILDQKQTFTRKKISSKNIILNIFLVFLTLEYKYLLLGTYFQCKKWMISENQEEQYVTIVCDTLCTQGFMIWFWKFNLLVQCFSQTFLFLVSLNQIANKEQICGQNIVPD